MAEEKPKKNGKKKPEMTIHEKLVYIQQNLQVKKGRYNKFGEYYYRSLEDVMEGLKPVLVDMNCTVTFTDELILIGERYYVKATVCFSDGVGRLMAVAFAREELAKKKQDGSQLTGGAGSYARKYAAGALFLIDDAADSDATNKHGKDANGKLTEPAKFKKENKTPPPEEKSKVDKEKESADLEVKINELMGLAFFEYQTVHANEMPDGKIFKKEYFVTEMRELFKGLSPKAKKMFSWNLTSVNMMAEKVLPVNCLTDIKVAPDA